MQRIIKFDRIFNVLVAAVLTMSSGCRSDRNRLSFSKAGVVLERLSANRFLSFPTYELPRRPLRASLHLRNRHEIFLARKKSDVTQCYGLRAPACSRAPHMRQHGMIRIPTEVGCTPAGGVRREGEE